MALAPQSSVTSPSEVYLSLIISKGSPKYSEHSLLDQLNPGLSFLLESTYKVFDKFFPALTFPLCLL